MASGSDGSCDQKKAVLEAFHAVLETSTNVPSAGASANSTAILFNYHSGVSVTAIWQVL